MRNIYLDFKTKKTKCSSLSGVIKNSQLAFYDFTAHNRNRSKEGKIVSALSKAEIWGVSEGSILPKSNCRCIDVKGLVDRSRPIGRMAHRDGGDPLVLKAVIDKPFAKKPAQKQISEQRRAARPPSNGSEFDKHKHNFRTNCNDCFPQLK
ncbi:hypothetical protein J6590_046970 [Homalodisca vitripennis]|nr:hypothetical protein J6590_046970 [Homalodisca vitripennis]